MTTASLADLPSRLYEAYASQHAGSDGDDATTLVHWREIRPLLPSHMTGAVVDLGCGRGKLVRLLQAGAFDAGGIVISAEQAALARIAGVARVRRGDFRSILAAYQARRAAITATDLLEHLTKPEVLQTFDDAAPALAPVGVFVGSIRRLAAAAGFDSVLSCSSPPVAHEPANAARLTIWQVVTICYRISLAAATGRLRGHIVTQNLTFAAGRGAVTVKPAES